MLIALDSDVLIAALSPHEAHSENAQNLLRSIASGTHKAVCSSLIYGEVLSVGTGKQPIDLEEFIEQIRNLKTIVADDDICLQSGKLRLEQGGSLKLPDAMHIVTAIKTHADLFITNDAKLAKKSKNLLPTTLLSDWV